MKAFILNQYNDDNVNLSYEDIVLHKPKDYEIQIKHECIGITRTNLLYCQGIYKAQLPTIIGTTAIGRIIALGNKVQGYNIDDQIVYSNDLFGAYTDIRNIDISLVFKIPTFYNYQTHTIAAYFENIYTSFQLLQRNAIIYQNDYVLIYGASGRLGHVMCQFLLRYHKAKVIAVVNSEQGLKTVNNIGVEHSFIGLNNIHDKILDITNNKGIKIIFDLVGGQDTLILHNSLSQYGSIIYVGNILGTTIIPKNYNIKNTIFIKKFNSELSKSNKLEFLTTSNQVFKILEKQIVVPQDIIEYKFLDIPLAHQDLSSKKYSNSSLVAKL